MATKKGFAEKDNRRMAEEKIKEKNKITDVEKQPKKTNKGVIALIVMLALGACGFGGWQYHENQIKEMQDKGVAELKAVVDLKDYREAEQKEIQALLDEGEQDILKLREQDEIDKVVSEASEKVKDFKTDAQYAKEEEAARQAELERQRQEEEAAAAAAAAQAAQSSSGGSSGGGCIGGGSSAFY